MEAVVQDDFLARKVSGGVPVSGLAGIVLAAGASRRMGSPKALLRWEGVTFLDRILSTFRRFCDPVVLVLGHHGREILAGTENTGSVLVTMNPRPEQGMLSSLQCGLRRLPVEASGVMFCPVDLPAVRPETAGLVVERFLKARPPVALPEFHGRHGHPVCISAEVAGEILALPPEAQASDVIHRHMTGALIVPVDDPGVVSDVDDRNDYRRLTEEAV